MPLLFSFIDIAEMSGFSLSALPFSCRFTLLILRHVILLPLITRDDVYVID